MKKNIFYQWISGIVTCLLLIGGISLGMTEERAYAASYVWKLVEGPVTEAGLEEYYGVSHKLSYEIDPKSRVIVHKRTTSYDTQSDGHVEGNFQTEYTLLPEVIRGGEKVYVAISASVDNNMKNFLHGNSANVCLNSESNRFYRVSDDSSSGSNLSISTGPNHVLKASETVYYEIPAGKEAGETMMIKAVTSQGQMSMGEYVGGMITHWTYRWTKVTPGRGAVAKIVNCKGAKVKVTAKKQAGLTKYQVRYKVAGAKNWTTTKTAKTPSFVIKVKKGKKVTVQVRGYNAYGAGDWSTSKSFQTDKK